MSENLVVGAGRERRRKLLYGCRVLAEPAVDRVVGVVGEAPQPRHLAADRGRELAPVGDEIVALRWRYLKRQLQALIARVDQLGGVVMSFDEEAKALYDAEPPVHPDEYFQQKIDGLESLLPGAGTLIDRYAEFKKAYIIPTDKLDAVFTVAIEACRERSDRESDGSQESEEDPLHRSGTPVVRLVPSYFRSARSVKPGALMSTIPASSA